MSKMRLDQALTSRGLTATRSQAESYVKLGYAKVNGKIVTKPGFLVSNEDKVELTILQQYVSRAALKLASVAQKLKLDFADKVVLDVGSSTGGFSDYALRHGAKKVIAVDVGAGQMHPILADDPRVELHEKTDIRELKKLSTAPDIVLVDVSFISLRIVLPVVASLVRPKTKIVAMCKPQFETNDATTHKGVVKNDALRRQILKDFELWAKKSFVILDKADSAVKGSKGNRERFYILKIVRQNPRT